MAYALPVQGANGRMFECPVCYNTMTGHIYQCQKGHSFCHTCLPKLSVCPECRGSINRDQLVRNLLAEQIRDEQARQKRNSGVLLKYPSFRPHLKVHPKTMAAVVPRQLNCPVECFDCNWKGAEDEVCRHVENEHSFWVNRNKIVELHIPRVPNLRSSVVNINSGVHFRICVTWNGNCTQLCHVVLQISPKDLSDYSYKILANGAQSRTRDVQSGANYTEADALNDTNCWLNVAPPVPGEDDVTVLVTVTKK